MLLVNSVSNVEVIRAIALVGKVYDRSDDNFIITFHHVVRRAIAFNRLFGIFFVAPNIIRIYGTTDFLFDFLFELLRTPAWEPIWIKSGIYRLIQVVSKIDNSWSFSRHKDSLVYKPIILIYTCFFEKIFLSLIFFKKP